MKHTKETEDLLVLTIRASALLDAQQKEELLAQVHDMEEERMRQTLDAFLQDDLDMQSSFEALMEEVKTTGNQELLSQLQNFLKNAKRRIRGAKEELERATELEDADASLFPDA